MASRAKSQRRDYLVVKQVGSPFSVRLFKNDGRLRIENIGPITKRDARRIGHWLLATFGDQEGA